MKEVFLLAVFGRVLDGLSVYASVVVFLCKSSKYDFSVILSYYCLKSLFEGLFTRFFVLVLHLFAFAYLCEKTHLRFDSNALVF